MLTTKVTLVNKLNGEKKTLDKRPNNVKELLSEAKKVFFNGDESADVKCYIPSKKVKLNDLDEFYDLKEYFDKQDLEVEVSAKDFDLLVSNFLK